MYAWVAILFICGKHLRDHIIALRKEVLTHKISLTSPLFIELPVPNQKCELSNIYVCYGYRFCLRLIFSIGIGTVHFIIRSTQQVENPFSEGIIPYSIYPEVFEE